MELGAICCSGLNHYFSFTAFNQFESVPQCHLVCSVTSGIPQASCLGPLLFILYINDVTDGFVGVSAKLFADVLKLYTEIDTDSSEINFQSHLDIIFSWASSWQLGISYSKCCILRLGRDPSQFSFSFNNTPIVTSDLVKDLGVYMTPDLSFASHIHDFVSRAKLRSYQHLSLEAS